MNIIVFEDEAARQLSPISLCRPAHSITCASFRLIDLLKALDGTLISLVRPHLERLQISDHPDLASELDSQLTWTLVVNARMAPSLSNTRRLEALMASPIDSTPTSKVVKTGWAVSAALVPTTLFAGIDQSQWITTIESLCQQDSVEVTEDAFTLFDYPHDVVLENLRSFHDNLRFRIENGDYHEVQPNVFLGFNVSIGDHAIFDASTGPIVIESNVKIGPLSYFRGPIYIGANSKISEHASIKDCVSIAHTCKIGGEVEGSIMEPYSNKQHHGFLGHSYLGSWINLGAGTCNSDLKNTYGIVNMQYGDQKVSTGSQFIGCIIGDYAKTAINTSIFTGKTIGVASMVYGFATTNVPCFVNYARTFDKFGILPPEVTVTTQKRMFERRDVVQRPCDVQLIHDIFRITADDRPEGLSREPISL